MAKQSPSVQSRQWLVEKPAMTGSATLPPLCDQQDHLEHMIAWTIPCASLNGRTETIMGSTTDKIKGSTNEAIGKAKQDVGDAIGSDRLQSEGAGQEAKGDAQQAMGKAKDALKGVANKVADEANRRL